MRWIIRTFVESIPDLNIRKIRWNVQNGSFSSTVVKFLLQKESSAISKKKKMTMVESFFTEDKFDCVITELIKRGYLRSNELSDKCEILWVNLKTLNFDRIDNNQIVNHFQGSQHFSNKVRLSIADLFTSC
jgi:hypothetical protein